MNYTHGAPACFDRWLHISALEMKKLGEGEHMQRFSACATAAGSSTSPSAKAGGKEKKKSEWIKAGTGPGAKCCCSSDKSAEEADSHSNLADMEPLLLRGQNYSDHSFCLWGCVRGPSSRVKLQLSSAAAVSSSSSFHQGCGAWSTAGLEPPWTCSTSLSSSSKRLIRLPANALKNFKTLFFNYAVTLHAGCGPNFMCSHFL